MSLSMIDAGQLHRQAQKQFFSIESIPYGQGVDPTRRYAPEGLSQLYYTPSYQLFDDQERLLYNQVVAIAVCEQFIFLEEYLLIPAVENLLAARKARLSAELRHCLIDFIDEEYKHSEMFWRLLETAAPDWYSSRRPAVYRTSRPRGTAMELMTHHPEFFVLWVWLAIVFEERTIDLYRKYDADPEVDPLFKEVHRFHMLDEARHFRIDQHLLAEVYDPAPMWIRRLNATLLSKVLGMFTSPTYAPWVGVKRVMERSPRLKAHRAAFARDIAGLGRNQAFQDANYSRHVLPQTFGLLDRYPEMAVLQGIMPMYQPLRTA